MQVGLRLNKFAYEGQKVVELRYKDHCVGEGYPDLVVRVGASEEQQLRNYMQLLQISRGILINFQQPGKKPGKTRLDIREIKF